MKSKLNAVELVRAEVLREPVDVRQPQLAHEDARPRIRVRDGAPAAIDVVELVAVLGRVIAGARIVGDLGHRRVLDEQRGRVDPDPGGAAVEPEAEDGFVFGTDVGMVPVEVRLFGGEEVEVPPPGWRRVRSAPGRALNSERQPVAARRRRRRAGAKPKRSRSGEPARRRLPQPMDPETVERCGRSAGPNPRPAIQRPCLGERPEGRID
jgi:hypothetical protein